MKRIFLVFIALIMAFFLGRFYEYAKIPTEPIFMSVNAEQFEKEIEDKKAVILDIRTPEEFEKGRIAGSINIDFYGPAFQDKLDVLDRNKTYKIYCNSGNKSAEAMRMMQELGFTNVTELSGGIEDWMAKDFPTCVNC